MAASSEKPDSAWLTLCNGGGPPVASTRDKSSHSLESYYVSKTLWHPISPVPICTYCRGRIRYRPVTIAVSKVSNDLVTRGFFCCWPCARSFANILRPSDEIERLTSIIIRDFAALRDEYDDPDGFQFVQQYTHFSLVPSAPPPDRFESVGGPLTEEKYRTMWINFNDGSANLPAPNKTLATSRPIITGSIDTELLYHTSTSTSASASSTDPSSPSSPFHSSRGSSMVAGFTTRHGSGFYGSRISYPISKERSWY
jgi:hypothetical protein